MGDAQTDAAFGKLDNGRSVFSTIVDVVFGGGFCVSNFFSVDPNTGLVHVAATAADALDGAEDGVSEHGALYLLDIVPSNRTGRGPREPGPGGGRGGGGRLREFGEARDQGTACQPPHTHRHDLTGSKHVTELDDGINNTFCALLALRQLRGNKNKKPQNNQALHNLTSEQALVW